MNSFTNNLIKEVSPYLLAHAHNPLNWYAWSEEAFEKAKKDNKLIFLSIGYSTCHWCHVMEKESFENEIIAQKMNQNYVSIKVDKEEMPHLDKKYQDIHYLLNRRAGGWPLSIIMTPSKEVVFAATYLPPHSKQNMMGLSEITAFISQKYKDEPQEVSKSAQSIKHAYEHFITQNIPQKKLEKNLLELYITNIKQNYDEKYKGIGSAPKFPHASTFDTLIDIFHITHSYEPLHLALESYEAMAKGGIYDQIEGGFYRYSVDESWMIPHFEKMLYTNAELISGYAKLYAIEKNPLFKRTVVQSIEALETRFLKEGVFYSASDADSKEGEGRYFVFNYKQVKEVLEKSGFEAKEILDYYGISRFGNFEDSLSNPYITDSNEPKDLLHVKQLLKEIREEREYPFVDYKVLTSWNALMLTALFEAGKYVDEIYSLKGFECLDSLLEKVYINETLYHQFVFEKPLQKEALLEDYSFLIFALLKAYQESFKEKYLVLAHKLSDEAIKKFYHKKQWYLSQGLESLASLEDASYKSSQALMFQNIAILGLLFEDENYQKLFEEMLEQNSGAIMSYPHAYPQALQAVLMKLFGAFVIKTSKQNFLHVKALIEEIGYPYLYLKEDKNINYQACSMENCFYNGENLEELKQKILENIL